MPEPSGALSPDDTHPKARAQVLQGAPGPKNPCVSTSQADPEGCVAGRGSPAREAFQSWHFPQREETGLLPTGLLPLPFEGNAVPTGPDGHWKELG